MIRFYLALWASKFYLFLLKLQGKEKDDKPGLLAYKICKDFIDRLNKPELVIAITGTNGKTTVSNFIADIFRKQGKKICFNTWDANFLSGHARCLMEGVTIFNKIKSDVAILETDELSSIESLPADLPDYLIVTNISKDSIRRNGNPDFIYERLKSTVEKIPNTTLILNADDPISFSLGEKNKKVFYSVEGKNVNKSVYLADDFAFCPHCYNDITYEYKHYRHIGKVKCNKCGFTSPKPDYTVTNIKDKQITVKEKNKKTNYPVISESIFNVYNELAVISLFRELGLSEKVITNYLKNIDIPRSRKTVIEKNGISFINQMAKGQNVSACSTVFEELGKTKEDIVVVLLINEQYGINGHGIETISWYYETDFEFLNKPHIKQILVGGPRYLDYKLRFELAGFDKNKYKCIENEDELYKYIDYKGIKKVYFLYEVEAITRAKNIRQSFIDNMKEDQK